MRTVVLVAFGGRSTEHDVSVITGVMALNALLGAGEDAVPLYIGRDGSWSTAAWMRDLSQFSGDVRKKTEQPVLLFGSDVLYLRRKNKLKPIAYVRAALSALHGKNGEDGAFPAVMHACHIPVSSPDMTESAILMDKWYAKAVFSAIGVNVLPSVCAGKEDFIKNSEETVNGLLQTLPLPVCVKPARSGSSIGISVATTREALAESLTSCFSYDFRAVIEPALSGFDEYGVAVWKKEEEIVVSDPVLQKKRGEVYTFAQKYTDGEGAEFLFGGKEPSGEKNADGPSPGAAHEILRDVARKVYRSMRLKGVVRFDFFVQNGTVYLNEINTVPGSLAFSYFAPDPVSAGAFFRSLISQAIYEERETEALTCTFPSSVLTSFSGGKRKG